MINLYGVDYESFSVPKENIMSDGSVDSQLVQLIEANQGDLARLGLLFLRLLHTDLCVPSTQPSPTLHMVLAFEQQGCLGLKKPLATLFGELRETSVAYLDDGFGGSVLRL
jgi:hypothetical protein